MVPFIETFQNVIRRLESEKINYMIVGSVAAMVYGEPRHTCDIVSNTELDQEYLLGWVEKLHLEESWAKI